MAREETVGMTVKKADDFTEWFVQLMKKAKLAEYTKVSGCVVYMPAAYELWEKIRDIVDVEFKKIGVRNAYFPMFIPESLLSQEAEHVEGFAAEVAWVTHGGNTKLAERLAVRPTSEAIMYDSYSKWIRSHRDLPLLINQWNNVVRWEFNNPTPFFRAREFLWNELHTCFATEAEALEHGDKVMKAYNKLTEEYMAIPGIYGQKTESEKFAGAESTRKVHSYLPNGKILEGTCFHYDGQKFAKAYDIQFMDESKEKQYVFQNTHAISVRNLGGMLAIHSDDKGLVIPPKMATSKLKIIPLLFKTGREEVLAKANELISELVEFNPEIDLSEDNPGRKFDRWELSGIPLRIEIGPRDLENNQVIIGTRHDGEKYTVGFSDIKTKIPELLEKMQNDLYNNAKKILEEAKAKTENKEELKKLIGDKKMVKSPLCDSKECEAELKSEIGGTKVLFIDPENEDCSGKKCINCGSDAKYWAYLGKTY